MTNKSICGYFSKNNRIEWKNRVINTLTFPLSTSNFPSLLRKNRCKSKRLWIFLTQRSNGFSLHVNPSFKYTLIWKTSSINPSNSFIRKTHEIKRFLSRPTSFFLLYSATFSLNEHSKVKSWLLWFWNSLPWLRQVKCDVEANSKQCPYRPLDDCQFLPIATEQRTVGIENTHGTIRFCVCTINHLRRTRKLKRKERIITWQTPSKGVGAKGKRRVNWAYITTQRPQTQNYFPRNREKL